MAAVVGAATGLAFPPSRAASAEAAIARELDRGQFADAATFARILLADNERLDDLVSQLTVGETYFFREPRQFELLRTHVLPAVAARGGPDAPLRVWSAGCATGEEPYSLAIALRELGLGSRAQVLGTDLSRARLERARAGVYRTWSLRGVPTSVVARYFQRRGDETFALAPDIRRLVEFRYLNLAEDSYPAISTGVWGMDVILCRNVMIYFDADTIVRVASRLLASLADDGWLLLGATDPPLGDLVPCETVRTAAGVAYRRGSGTRAAVSRPIVPPLDLAPPWRDDGPRLEPDPPAPIEPPAAPLSGSPPNDVVADLEELYAAHDYERAADIARARTATDRDDARAWIVLIRSLANLGRLGDAGEACATALDRYRLDAEVAYLHAVLLMQANRFADAVNAARRALYLDPSMIVAHLTAGAASAKLGDDARARRAFESAERMLAAMPSDAIVPASDGERAARLAEMARLQARLARSSGS